jgi:hypothetical protein
VEVHTDDPGIVEAAGSYRSRHMGAMEAFKHLNKDIFN